MPTATKLTPGGTSKKGFQSQNNIKIKPADNNLQQQYIVILVFFKTNSTLLTPAEPNSSSDTKQIKAVNSF
jgi:hypothetical protein